VNPSPAALRARFGRCVAALGGRAEAADAVADTLLAAWAEPHRRYHDLEHLADCLRELDEAGAPAGRAVLAELALWYHDVVYVPGRGDSEARSAARLEADGSDLGLPDDVTARAAALVRATAHLGADPEAPLPDDAALVVDVDLAILGQPPERFLRFEHAVREEYAGVPRLLYFARRKAFLRRLLAAGHVYRTEAFRRRYEARARANVEALLRSPRYRWWRWIL
jgi:predicted metal-dependent HD superfamily phosphohydrolase